MRRFLRTWGILLVVVLLASSVVVLLALNADSAQASVLGQPLSSESTTVVAVAIEEELAFQSLKSIGQSNNPFHVIGKIVALYSANSITYTKVTGLEVGQFGELRLYIDMPEVNGVPVKYLHLLGGSELVPEGHPAESEWMSIPTKAAGTTVACFLKFFN